MSAAAGRVKRRTTVANPRLVYGLAALFAFAVVWEAVVRLGIVSTRFLAPPTEALGAGWLLVESGRIWSHLWTSFQEFALGFLLAIVVGTALGFAMAQWRRVDLALGPTVWAIYSVPREAFIPLLLVWFGIGIGSKVAVVFLGALFPLIANTYLGVRSTDPISLRAARAFCANRREILAKVVLPSSVPFLIDGLRLGAGRGLIGVVVAEMYVSREGIGYLLMQAAQNFRTAQLIFEVILVAAFGIAISQALLFLERRFAGWRRAGAVSE